MEASKSMPFLDQPPALDGSMAGDVGVDPFQISSVLPLAWLREAEIKHARICMLASAGFVANDLGFKFPGEGYAGISSVAAHDAMVDSGEMYVLVLAVIVIETFAGLPKALELLNKPENP